jgi:aspartate/methionine/tyrosine aminotransferase
MFSSRVPGDLEPNRVSRLLQTLRAAGRNPLDLTLTNPTAAGIEYPPSLLDALADREALRYEPAPLGLACARAAVAGDYARRGIDLAADRIVLTASTSEAYSVLFKLLCDAAGDAVMVPSPSYPLFDHLARLDGVTPIPYRLEYHGRWTVDFETIDTGWTDRVRAVLAVSPNNPTGSILTGAELEGLARRCRERGAALIVDEVFADYPLAGATAASGRSRPDDVPPVVSGSGGCGDAPPVVSGSGRCGDAPPVMSGSGGCDDAPPVVSGSGGYGDAPPVVSGFSRTRDGRSPCLTFLLGGLSKSAGLPQVKLGWIAVDGPDALVRGAIDRLEFICDTYLSVATPVQLAAQRLIDGGATVRQRILERVLANHDSLRLLSAAYPSICLLHSDAGWSAALRVPSTRSEEDLVLELLEQDHVLVHPGFFFDFPHEAFLVVSLLPEPAVFREAIRRVLQRVHM